MAARDENPPTRMEILDALRQFSDKHGTPSKKRFFEETGIRESQIIYFWPRWSDAVREAGAIPHERVEPSFAHDRASRLKVARFAVELGRVPTRTEIRLGRRDGRDLPGGAIYSRLFTGKDIGRELADLVDEVDGLAALIPETPVEPTTSSPSGWVYLMKSGSHYKIGATTNILRREGELQVAIPGGVEPIHTLETDDPYGIEAYWHRRFGDRRVNGEWFALSTGDVAAFCSRGDSM